MPEANIFEKTKLILKAKISRGKARNEKATWTIKNQGSGEEKKIEVKISKDATDVACEYETTEVPAGKDNYLLTYQLEADGRKFAGAYPYRVWPHYFNLKALGKDGKAFPGFPFKVKQAGAPPVSENGKGPQTGDDGTRRVDLKVTGAVTVEAVSPFVIDKWTAGKDKGRDLEAHVSRKPFTAGIYAPTDKDIKQYVNMPPSSKAGAAEGSRLKIQVGAKEDKGKPAAERVGIAGDEIFIQVIFSDKNSKRNKPQPRLIVGGADVAPESDKRTYKSKVKLGEGGEPAVFEVEMGLAGGDVCDIKVGVTDACADDKIKVTTWRKLTMEIIQPKPDVISSYTVFKSDKTAGLSDDQVNALTKELGKDKVYIEMDTKTKSLTYDAADLGAIAPYVVFDGAYFQREAGKKMVCLSGDHYGHLQSTKGSNPQKKTSMVTVWADWYSDAADVVVDAKMEAQELPYNISDPQAVFKFDPVKADGTLGIKRLYWQTIEYLKSDGVTWAPITQPSDPGYSKNLPQEVPLDWAELQHFVEFVHFRKIKIKLPKRPGKPGDAGNQLVQPGGKKVKIGVHIEFAGAQFSALAAGWHGFIWMSTFGGKFKTGGLISTLLHELGHNLGQAYANKAVDATYGRTDANIIPGIPFPPGVPEGVVYGGKGHTGTHCATGVRRNNRANPSFVTPPASANAIQNEATCIMFGSGDMNSATMREYCEQCRTFIKATEAHNITKAWES